MPLKLRPTSNRVVILPDPQKRMTDAGVFIPSTAKHVPKIGTIVSVGPGFVVDRFHESPRDPRKKIFPRMPMEAEPGDRVFFSTNTGTQVEIDGQTFIVLRMTDVLAFVEEKETEDESA